MVNKKGLGVGAKIYFAFLFIIALALGLVYYLDNSYTNNITSLEEQYEIDKSKGEILVECDDGSYDVYKPYEVITKVCGQTITNNVSTS